MSSRMKNASIAKRSIINYLTKRPLCVSFEVTYRCNARCGHCHLGGPVEESPAPPERYGELCRMLNPVVAQISGGEPLLRRDIYDIVRELARPNRAPMVVMTTNAKLLSLDKYYALRGLGVNEFSISLDYPDERHDEFRTIPGLFRQIERLLQAIEAEPDKGITLACVVQRKNFRDLPRLAHFAHQHGVKMSFSTYTWLRTQDKSWMIPREELPELRAVIDELKAFGKETGTLFTSDYVFERMIRFFEEERVPGCKAGETFLVVNPSGTISPCGLIQGDYRDQQDVVDNFLRHNTCEACNTSIRANTEKPLGILARDALASL